MTSSTVQSQSSTSSSATPTPTLNAVEEYSITSKRGTSAEVFKKFATELDGGKGFMRTYDVVQTQLYLANLNATQVRNLTEQYSWIEYIDPTNFGEPEDGPLEEFRSTSFTQLVSTKTQASHDLLKIENLSHPVRRAWLPVESSAPW